MPTDPTPEPNEQRVAAPVELMKCRCGFVVRNKGEAATHLDRANRYAPAEHFFESLPDRRVADRRKGLRTPKPASNQRLAENP